LRSTRNTTTGELRAASGRPRVRGTTTARDRRSPDTWTQRRGHGASHRWRAVARRSQTFPGARRIKLGPAAVVRVVFVRASRKVSHAGRGDQQGRGARARCPAPLGEPVLARVTVHLAESAVGHALHDGAKLPRTAVRRGHALLSRSVRRRGSLRGPPPLGPQSRNSMIGKRTPSYRPNCRWHPLGRHLSRPAGPGRPPGTQQQGDGCGVDCCLRPKIMALVKPPIDWSIPNLLSSASGRCGPAGRDAHLEGQFEGQNGARESSAGPAAASVSWCRAWSGCIWPGRRTG
jgi:hypothetical protein